MSTTPHDGLFKAVFSHPEHALGALRPVVPAAMAEALDWSTLALQPGSFVDSELFPAHTDLLYTAAWRGGAEAPVYVLFEHQSSSDRWMPFRLLRYMVRIWEHWLEEHKQATALPAIVPIVLYHGDERWSAARAFEALLDVPEAVRPTLDEYLVRFAYVLDDLSKVPDERLRVRDPMTALVGLCLKYAQRGSPFVEMLSQSGGLVRDAYQGPHGGREAFQLVWSYIFYVVDTQHHQALRVILQREIGPEAKDILMTIAEKFRQEGREQGLEQGERRALLRQLRKRFGAQVNDDTERRVAAASPEQIALWLDRVLSAVSLAELLAD
jgi:predicted transposase YdaD